MCFCVLTCAAISDNSIVPGSVFSSHRVKTARWDRSLQGGSVKLQRCAWLDECSYVAVLHNDKMQYFSCFMEDFIHSHLSLSPSVSVWMCMSGGLTFQNYCCMQSVLNPPPHHRHPIHPPTTTLTFFFLLDNWIIHLHLKLTLKPPLCKSLHPPLSFIVVLEKVNKLYLMALL